MNDKPKTDRPKVLVVDDRRENRTTILALLEELQPQVTVIEAESGDEALGLLLEHDFAVVLMDVQMPGMDGFETVEMMRKHKRTRQVPVVFVTAISTERRFVARGYEVGAVDYLSKPIDPDFLRSKVRVFVDLFEKTRLLEEKNAELQAMAARLRDASLTDPLTGLRNRRFLVETVDSELAISRRLHADRRADRLREAVNIEVGFVMIDVDHFKRVNDTHGHDAGDRVLVEIAGRIGGALRDSDCLVRWGGEEFLVLLRRTAAEGLSVVAERIRAAVADTPCTIEGGTCLEITCSLGFSRYPVADDDSYTWEDVVAIADKALYRAKQAGRDTWVGVEVHKPPSSRSGKLAVLDDLDRAAADGRIRLVGPKLDG